MKRNYRILHLHTTSMAIKTFVGTDKDTGRTHVVWRTYIRPSPSIQDLERSTGHDPSTCLCPVAVKSRSDPSSGPARVVGRRLSGSRRLADCHGRGTDPCPCPSPSPSLHTFPPPTNVVPPIPSSILHSTTALPAKDPLASVATVILA